MSDTKERWDALLREYKWRKLPRDRKLTKTEAEAKAIMADAWQFAQDGNWLMAKLTVRSAAAAISGVSVRQPDEPDEDEPPPWDEGRARTVLYTAIRHVNAVASDKATIEQAVRSLDLFEPMNEAWRAKDMNALEAACAGYKRTVSSWFQ